MRIFAFAILFSLAAANAWAIEFNRTVDPIPTSEVPSPEDAPPLPPPNPNAPHPAAPKHLELSKVPKGQNATPAKLSDKDADDLKRIENYLNSMRNIGADFLQVDDQGGMMRGTIAIQRPGKMRVNYAPPSKDFIVADGDMVHIWDGSLKSQSNVPEDASLASFILRDPVALSGEVTVVKFERFPAKLEVTLVQTKDPNAGALTLIFEDHPLILRQWRVIDAQGRTTGVNLENEKTDVKFDRSLFNFVPPSFGKGGKAQ